jgi:hypothetical protein
MHHFSVNHSAGEFERTVRFRNCPLSVHTGTIDSVWVHLKKNIPASLSSKSPQIVNIAFVRGNGGSRTPMSQTCLLQLGASWNDWRNDGRNKLARVLKTRSSKKNHILKKSLVVETIKRWKTYFTWENTCNQASTALMRFAWWWLTEANTRYRGQERKAFRASCIVPKLR